MTAIRVALAAYTLAFCIGGYLLITHMPNGTNMMVTVYFLMNVGVLVAGIIFERERYSQNHLPSDGWQHTKEKFIDDTSGRMVHVDYHPATGQRRYRETS